MTHYFVAILDLLLLVYFVYVGLKNQNKKIWILAFAQILLFLPAEYFAQNFDGANFIIDKLSLFMMIIINLIGGAINIYAVYYMKYENSKKLKKTAFLIYLWIFLIIMNLAVASNNLLYFFFFFELTTLSSFLLISFRGDDVSRKNSQNALVLNQIGGLFLLIAVLINELNGHSIYMNQIIENKDFISSALIFIAFAAFVKGACKPFESWLLGAMVAPTPVSALLHSATMVKIAPFLILKFAPIFTSDISFLIQLLGMFLFFVFALEGLNKNSFKEILAYSTISMLALMISVSAINSPISMQIAMWLIFFHAISKAILFMLAGILEKIYHIKNIDELSNFYSTNKNLALMILISFASVTLPPFGMFFAKLFFLQYLASAVGDNIFNIAILIFFALGSSVLVLLYFKIASLLMSQNAQDLPKSKVDFGLLAPNYFLFLMMAIAVIYVGQSFDVWNLIVIFGTIFAVLLISVLKVRFQNIQKVQVYACGEKTEQVVGQFYFDFSKFGKLFLASSFALWAAIFLGGLI